MRSSPRSASRPAAAGIVLALTASFMALAPATSAAPRIAATEARDLTIARHGLTRISTTVALPIRANMIGVSWSGGDASVEVRLRSIRAGWSEWQALEANDLAPDAGSAEGGARRATEPMWVGTADRLSLRMRAARPVSEVRVHAINTLGDARPVSLLARIGRAIGSAFRGAPRAAQASPAVPQIRTRAQWGADERWRRCCPRYAQTVEVAFIHHTASTNVYSATDAPGMIRAIYRYHRYALDYDDIAYNFIVDRYGVIYEGRAGGITSTTIGAHTEGMNARTTGVALLGTFSSAYPTSSMMISLQKLLAWKLDVHHIPPNGTVPMTSSGSALLRRGQTVNMPRIAGHRQAQSTDCPGNAVYNQLPRIRSTIQPWGAPKFYLSSAGRVLRIDGDTADETAPVKVWMSSALRWRIEFKDVGGNAARTFTGTGTIADVFWDGRDAITGRAAATGVGQIRIEGWNDQGVPATPVVIPLYVVNDHPVGTILQTDAGRWVVGENAVVNPIPTDAVFTSWYRSAEAVPTTATEIARYTAGLPIAFRNGTLVKTPDGAYHFITGGARRAFASQAIFDALGYTDGAAVPATQQEIDAIPQGTTIADAAVHPEGQVVRDSGGVAWVIEQATRRKVPSRVVRRSWFRDSEVVEATAGDLALPEGTAYTFRPGALLKTDEGIHWMITGATRRSFRDPWFYAAYGFRSTAPMSATWPEITILPYGGQIT